jgi:predicted acetylornithine/succinylornithine family transaminase
MPDDASSNRSGIYLHRSQPQTAPGEAVTETSPSHQTFLLGNYSPQDVTFVRGEGCYLTDEHGKRYLDAFAGVAVSALGHGHPALSQAIAKQAKELIHTSNHYHIAMQERLAKLLVANAFPSRVLFCNSGTEAIEAAYKAVRLWGNIAHGGKKKRIIAFTNGFHGRTIGSLSITANPAYREPFEPLPGAEFLPFGDLKAFTAALRDDVAGVFIELIQGEGGVNVAPPAYLAGVRDLCTKHGVLLVIDEIQTGVGRTGKLFCHQHEAITPDIMTLAKGLGGGVPIGATLFSEKVAALFKPGMHGTTFGGNPLACVAGMTVMNEVLKPGFLANVEARGKQLTAGLRELFASKAVEIRGRGLLLGVQLKPELTPAALVKASLAQGLVVGPSGNNTLRLAPPLIITEVQVGELLGKLKSALESLAK